MADNNKVRFGFKSVYYSIITETADTITYGEPKKWPGARSITMDPDGDSGSTYYADDIAYFTSSSVNGYSGSLTMAYLPEQIQKDIFGYIETTDGMLAEDANANVVPVALLYECNGDKNQVRHTMYKVVFSRPSFEANTKKDSISPDEISMDYTSVPVADDADHAWTKSSCPKGAAAYNTFFETAPHLPAVQEIGG